MLAKALEDLYLMKKRIEFLSYIKLINYVFVSNSRNAINSIKLIKPNVYCKGPDYKDNNKDITGQIKLENDTVKRFGGKFIIQRQKLLVLAS